ncbi:RGCVC family protein [Lentzea sp. NEAU-D7]|uniref:RGCVC family protein n=1 Tax=Lentzea sp. NEAU-D7 TaxID=2994667 RepID=UPI00224A5420|nr:RGCVC family protein [Lentzea sp. NEAU-D7]MCX2951364.1 RGCVC family protein [Lentzea sp. NEAU-D7]
MPVSELHTTELADHSDSAGACAVCPHPWHEHDPLGVRYCTATAASALSRGCICR